MQGAEVLTKFTADSKEVDKATSNLSKKLGGLAKGIGKSFVAGVGVATVAVTGLLKTSVDAFGEMEQLSGGAQKIFDEMDYSKIEKDATNAYKNMNMSARQYLSAINTVGANFASTLGDEKGYKVAKDGLQAISDFASGTGQNVDVLTQKFQAIAKSTSSYQSIADQFAGILPATSKEFLKQAQDLGYLSKEYKNLTEVPMPEYQETLSKMLKKGTKELGLQNNTANEATKTLTGSLAAAKGAFDNFISGVGSIDDVVSTFITASKQIGKAIKQMLPIVTDGLVSIINGLIPQVPNLIQKLLPSVIHGAISLVQGIINTLPTFLTMLANMLPSIITSLIQGFTKVVNSLAEQAPVLIPLVVNAIIDGLLSILNNIDLLIDCGIQLLLGLTEGIISAIPQLIERMPLIIQKVVSALISNAPKLMTVGPRLILQLGNGLINSIPSLVLRVPRIIKAIINGLKDGIKGASDVGKNIVKGLWNGLGSMKDWVINKVKGMGKAILGGLKKVLGVHSPSTQFALVGKFSGEGYIEGLEGMQKEIDKTVGATFNPFSNSSIGSMNASTPQTNITIQNSMKYDALGQLVNNVKTFSGGAKNDYNYVGWY